jgi:hypothetical protein
VSIIKFFATNFASVLLQNNFFFRWSSSILWPRKQFWVIFKPFPNRNRYLCLLFFSHRWATTIIIGNSTRAITEYFTFYMNRFFTPSTQRVYNYGLWFTTSSKIMISRVAGLIAEFLISVDYQSITLFTVSCRHQERIYALSANTKSTISHK